MKKVISLCIGFILAISLIGCGQSSSTKTSSNQNANSSKNAKTEAKQIQLPIEKEQNGIKVQLTKVEQDSNSLKIYVTYTNNTKNQLKSNKSNDKIVVNGKQLNYNANFNVSMIKKLKLTQTDYVKPSATANDVILFAPVKSSKISMTLCPNNVPFNFNDVPVTTKK